MTKQELKTQFELQEKRVYSLRYLLLKTDLFFDTKNKHTQLFKTEFELYKNLKKDLMFIEMDKHSKKLLDFWNGIKDLNIYDDFSSFYDDFYEYYKDLFFSYGGELFEDEKETNYFYDLSKLMLENKDFNEQLKTICLKDYEKTIH